MLGTAGVLGETYLAIDTIGGSGPPAGANTVLKSRPTVEPNTEQMMQKLGEFMQKKNCDCDCKKNTANLGKLSPRIPRTESPGAPGLGG
jgi:hypothetical protein